MFLLVYSFILNCFLNACRWGHTLLFQAYLDELVELHRRLMTLRERHILQQVRNTTLCRSLRSGRLLNTTLCRSLEVWFVLRWCGSAWRPHWPHAVWASAMCRVFGEGAYFQGYLEVCFGAFLVPQAVKTGHLGK